QARRLGAGRSHGRLLIERMCLERGGWMLRCCALRSARTRTQRRRCSPLRRMQGARPRAFRGAAREFCVKVELSAPPLTGFNQNHVVHWTFTFRPMFDRTKPARCMGEHMM